MIYLYFVSLSLSPIREGVTLSYWTEFPVTQMVLWTKFAPVFPIFFWGGVVPLENLSLIWRLHHCRWRTACKFWPQYSWPLSREGSLACQTYCDTGHPFMMVISEDPWHSHLLPSVSHWSCHYLFYDFGVSRLEFEHVPNLPHARRTL